MDPTAPEHTRSRSSPDRAQTAAHLRILGEAALSRTAGAPLVSGNRLRLLRDATENFPAWLEAIDGARQSISFEPYIMADDAIGNRFADALAARARAGVRVRLLHDWVGTFREASSDFWYRLEDAGVEVRCFNPFRIQSPLAWLRRNHRKSIVVDGRTGFVTGLCVAARWAGDQGRGIPPWRDTGVQIEGPAVADLARAFSRVWAETGPPISPEEIPRYDDIPPVGPVSVRVIDTEPSTSGLYRLDQLIAAMARERLWLTDAYFIATPTYVQALRAAAQDGVDVRFLVPGTSDLGLIKALGAAGYRPLLESGVRVFEWNGPMLHAKTAVADGRWARVGSSNLNLSSWLGNWELDLAVEDERFGLEMERQFEADLENSTELVLGVRRRRSSASSRLVGPHRRREGSAIKTAGAFRLGNAVSAALGGSRVLGETDIRPVIAAGLLLLLLAAVSMALPRVVVIPVALAATWLGFTLIMNGVRLLHARREAARREAELEEKQHDDDPDDPLP